MKCIWGCVKLTLAAGGSQEAGFTQPLAEEFALQSTVLTSLSSSLVLEMSSSVDMRRTSSDSPGSSSSFELFPASSSSITTFSKVAILANLFELSLVLNLKSAKMTFVFAQE